MLRFNVRRDPCAGRLLVAVVALVASATSVAVAQDLTLTHATLIDGTGAAPVRDVTVVVRAGKIAQIVSGASPPPVSGEVIDLRGRYLLPGLIDGHAHVLSPDAALRALQSGVTTVRVMGDTNLQALGTRDLIRGGHVPGAELLVSGDIIRPKPGMAFFVTFPQFGQYVNTELRGATTIAAVVRTLLDRGVDQIKVGASDRAGLAASDPRRPELTLEEMHAAVAEAKKAGKFVEAHAHAESGAEAAVRAGVRSIAHGTYLNQATLQLMKAQGTFLVPTLATMSPLNDPPGDTADEVALMVRTRHMHASIRNVVRQAKRLGVPIVASTDGSYGAAGGTGRLRLQHDMEEMLACGFSPIEAIVAATREAARLAGIDARTGTIQVGFEADLLVVDRDPTAEFTTLYEPIVVINNGKVVRNRIY